MELGTCRTVIGLKFEKGILFTDGELPCFVHEVKEELTMLAKVRKVLGMITPLIAAISAYQMLFGMMYTGATSNSSTPQISTTIKVTALEFAFKQGSKVVIFWTIFWTIFWPVAIFLLSCIGAIAVWKRITILVWVIACLLLIVSVAGIFSIGLLVAPIAILLLISAIVLLIEKSKAIG